MASRCPRGRDAQGRGAAERPRAGTDRGRERQRTPQQPGAGGPMRYYLLLRYRAAGSRPTISARLRGGGFHQFLVCGSPQPPLPLAPKTIFA